MAGIDSVLGSASLSPGGGDNCAQAQLTWSNLLAGSHTLTAQYSGDATYAAPAAESATGGMTARPKSMRPASLPDRIGPRVVRRSVPEVSWPQISTKMASDPSLKYTEGGRAFLRWMSAHSMQADEWREFVDAIPQHWLEEVGRIAVSMSEEWRQFAERLGSKLQAVG